MPLLFCVSAAYTFSDKIVFVYVPENKTYCPYFLLLHEELTPKTSKCTYMKLPELDLVSSSVRASSVSVAEGKEQVGARGIARACPASGASIEFGLGQNQ